MIRAMPENEKPPAMRVDFYYIPNFSGSGISIFEIDEDVKAESFSVFASEDEFVNSLLYLR